MKCVADAANGGLILRVSDASAEFLIKDKPNRYSYVNKNAFKAERAYLADNAKRAPETWGKEAQKRVRKSRAGRSKNELR